MSKYTTQRVQYLLDHYMEYHLQGYSNKEIAQKCNVSITTLYNNLGKIAQKHGVTRDSLLERHLPSREDTTSSYHKDKVNREELMSKIKETKDRIELLMARINSVR